MAAVAERFESLAAEFEALRRESRLPDASWHERQRAFDRFLAAGFPSTRDEEWRFTNIAPIAGTAFMRARAVEPSLSAVEPFLLPAAACHIVLVNGRVSAPLSSLDRLPGGVTARSRSNGGGVRRASELEGRVASSAFTDLNEAFYEDALEIEIAANTVLADPIQVISLTAADGPPALVVPRLLIRIGERAEVTIVESYAGLSDEPSLTSAVTDIQIGAGAIAQHVKIQREPNQAFHMASLSLHLERSSTFSSTALTFGGRIARNDILATLAGEGAECTLNGLYVVTGHRLADTHTTIDHAKPHCPSHEVYKGILGGHARAVFNGKIIVRPQAQKTDAKQTNKALLLTDDAQINTKPQLEIFADDVKCTHGAAIGQLDDDALFYLRARGIGEADARSMLIHAFAADVLNGISAPSVREHAMALLDEKLAEAGLGM